MPPPKPRSRRDRPAKPPLSREWIVSTTIDIMQHEGLERATMRRVAQALDTGPASLYVYVTNTAELHAAVLDELLGTLAPRIGGGWQERLEDLLEDYRNLLFAYPGLARSALLIRPNGPHSLILVDRALGFLLEGGIEAARAAWGVDLLILLATANAAEHSTPTPPDDHTLSDNEADWTNLALSVRNADSRSAPHVAQHAEALLSGSPDQRWSWAVRAAIAGIAQTAALPNSIGPTVKPGDAPPNNE